MLEKDEQRAVYAWALSQQYRCKPLRFLTSMPDSMHSHLGSYGNRKGYPDIFLPYPASPSALPPSYGQHSYSQHRGGTAIGGSARVARPSVPPNAPPPVPAALQTSNIPLSNIPLMGPDTGSLAFALGEPGLALEEHSEATPAVPRTAKVFSPPGVGGRGSSGPPPPISPISSYAGLFIELKRYKPRGYLSREQKDWLAYLTEVGYCAIMCRGSYAAILTIQWYLSEFELGEGYMEYEIDHGIPVPTVLRTRVSRYNYPFAKLGPGDSFHVAPGEFQGDLKKIRSRLGQAVGIKNKQEQAHQPSYKLVVAPVGIDDPRGEGIRVHRVA